MDIVQEIRRNFILLRKRLSFLRYNISYKYRTGSVMDLKFDEEQLFDYESKHRKQ